MDILLYMVFAVVGAVFALGTYIFVRKILLKGQKEEIIKKAELEAESIKKEKIFQAKVLIFFNNLLVVVFKFCFENLDDFMNCLNLKISACSYFFSCISQYRFCCVASHIS